MAPSELELELPGGTRLAALAWGSPEAAPVLALHGWLDSAVSFARLAPRLEGLRIVALDLPGHGRSDHFPAGWSHHFVDWVPVVLGAMDGLGWSCCRLLGHSMGAGISSLLPAVAPERVERVVLLEGAGPLSAPAADAPQALARALEEEAAWRARPAPRPFPDLETAVTARMRGTALDREAAQLLVERGADVTGEGVVFRHDPRLKLRSRLRLTEDQVRAFLAGIRCPVLAIRADEGWPFPEEQVRERLALIPDCRVVTVPGDHHVHLTYPERVADLVGRFLTDPD